MQAICPRCGHHAFRSIGQPGHAACMACGNVSTRSEAVAAGADAPVVMAVPLRPFASPASARKA